MTVAQPSRRRAIRDPSAFPRPTRSLALQHRALRRAHASRSVGPERGSLCRLDACPVAAKPPAPVKSPDGTGGSGAAAGVVRRRFEAAAVGPCCLRARRCGFGCMTGRKTTAQLLRPVFGNGAPGEEKRPRYRLSTRNIGNVDRQPRPGRDGCAGLAWSAWRTHANLVAAARRAVSAERRCPTGQPMRARSPGHRAAPHRGPVVERQQGRGPCHGQYFARKVHGLSTSASYVATWRAREPCVYGMDLTGGRASKNAPRLCRFYSRTLAARAGPLASRVVPRSSGCLY